MKPVEGAPPPPPPALPFPPPPPPPPGGPLVVPPLARGLTTPPPPTGPPPPPPPPVGGAPTHAHAPHRVGEMVDRTARRPWPLASVGAVAEVLHPMGVVVFTVSEVVPHMSDWQWSRDSVNGLGMQQEGTYDVTH